MIVSTCGKKSIRHHSLLPRCNTVHFVRVRHLLPKSDRHPWFQAIIPKQATCSASFRSVLSQAYRDGLSHRQLMHTIFSPTGTPLAATSPQTLVEVALEGTPTLSSLLSTPSTLPRDATPRPSSPVLTRRSRTLRSTSTLSALSMASTVASVLLLPSLSVVTQRIATTAAIPGIWPSLVSQNSSTML